MFRKFILILLTFSTTIITLQTHSSTESPALNAKQWRYDTDPYGSKATIKSSLIENDSAWIHFNRIPRVDAKRNSWIELIYDIPTESLGSNQTIRLHYKCDQPLLVKLSQKDYGGAGDKSYAHYQATLPAAAEWQTQEVSLRDFQRPSWTPTASVDKGILADNVSSIYLVPKLTDKEGGEATLEVKAIELLP